MYENQAKLQFLDVRVTFTSNEPQHIYAHNIIIGQPSLRLLYVYATHKTLEKNILKIQQTIKTIYFETNHKAIK